MKIKILYFAQLAEFAKKDEELIELSAGSVELLYEELKTKYDFPLPFKRVQVAVNHEMVGRDYPLKEGDELVFLPPMAGG